MTIIETSSSVDDTIDNNDRPTVASHSAAVSSSSSSPPNGSIKLMQPRKKELWLPWPLGALRNDFYEFASKSGGDRGEEGQEWHHRGLRRQHDHEFIGGYTHQQRQDDNGMLQRGRNWANKMFTRVSIMPMMPVGTGSHTNNRLARTADNTSPTGGVVMGTDNQKLSGYWVRDTTTPMATASATMNKNGKKQIVQRRGGGGVDAALAGVNGENDKHFDRDVVFRYLKLQASVRLRQLGYVGSDVSVHLPPASPILLFYYFLPAKQDPIRRLVKYTMAGATLSWMHSEATKYRRFAALPIMKGINVRNPKLPPFLPKEMADSELAVESAVVTNRAGKDVIVDTKSNKKGRTKEAKSAKENTNKAIEQEEEDESTHNHHHLWDPFQSFGTLSSAYRTWLEGYNLRNKQSYQQRRVQALEQLLEMKKTKNDLKGSSSNSTIADATGYALVTGASQGIGRAIAIELARYQIPLILVARDLVALSSVAKDIEKYGVPCRVLQADLSVPDCASRIHAATTSAGLDVDILVNNAGVCDHGQFLESDAADFTRMVQVNIGATTQLSRLYGADMKERRRGRILFVSSMSGVLPGNPSVAVYSATKAYGKSLATSLGREMERFGVGVTCCLPGAVKDTSFASRSLIEEAACFHFPGYAKTSELVASEGVKGLMLGYPEIYPGWMNRAFVKMFLPMLPPRASTMIGEWAWNPWRWGDVMPQKRGGGESRISREMEEQNRDNEISSTLPSQLPAASSSPSAHIWKFGRSSSSTPSSNQMQLPGLPKSSKVTTETLPGDVTSKATFVESVDPTSQTHIDQNITTITDDDAGSSLGMESKAIQNDRASTNHPPSLANPQITAALGKVGEDSSASDTDRQKSSGKESTARIADGGKIDSTEDHAKSNKDSAMIAQNRDLPQPLVLPPASEPSQSDSQPQSSPLALLGFFDSKSQAAATASNEESTAMSDDDVKNKTVDSIVGKTGGAAAELPADNNAPWYPSMMDKKDYDFRDRRLDY